MIVVLNFLGRRDVTIHFVLSSNSCSLGIKYDSSLLSSRARGVKEKAGNYHRILLHESFV